MPRYMISLDQERLRGVLAVFSGCIDREIDFYELLQRSNIPKAMDDLKKVEFDLENIMDKDSENWDGADTKLLGFHTVNGKSFCGLFGGGDWEFPVFFILYCDGKDIRAYIPEKGNVYNKDLKSAIGNNEDEDDAYCRKTYNRSYEEVETGPLFEAYDWDAILADIDNRLQLREY